VPLVTLVLLYKDKKFIFNECFSFCKGINDKNH
jgi:hypothetical protein